MAKLLTTYDDLPAAQAAAQLLTAQGVGQPPLATLGESAKSSAQFFKALAWGGVLGGSAALLLPHGGAFLLAGHLARATILPTLGKIAGLTVKGVLAGAASGGAIGWLRQARENHQSTNESSVAGNSALTLAGDWATRQRAQEFLGQVQPTDRARLLELVNRYGYEHQSFVLLYGGLSGALQTWWSDEPEAAIVYTRVGRVLVIGAAPLTARENMIAVLQRFLAFCQAEKLACLMLPIGVEAAAAARACGMGLLQIGETGYFKLPEWKPAGDRAKKVRAGVNQARKAGLSVVQYDPQRQPDPSVRAEIEQLCQQWIATREVDALGWLLELDPFKLAEHKRYFLARDAAGRLQGLLACCPIPARQGWYLEDLIRRQDAPRGVSELLIVTALQQLAAEGAHLATLATSPLAGMQCNGQFKYMARLLKLIYQHLDAFYHFKALHRFKAKFAPSFNEADYVAFYPPRIRVRMVSAVIRAFDPGGLTNLCAAKLRKLWHARRQSMNSQASNNQAGNPEGEDYGQAG